MRDPGNRVEFNDPRDSGPSNPVPPQNTRTAEPLNPHENTKSLLFYEFQFNASVHYYEQGM
jgi:hypothetical protein